MSDSGLPRPERFLVALLLRGPGAEFVRGDLEERWRRDRAERPDARRRLRRNVVGTVATWWSRRAVAARRDRSRGDHRGRVGMRGWVQDGRNAVRSMRRRPGFATGVVLTLGLGIGATTTVFSVVDGVLLEPLPYDEPDRLAAVGTTFPTREWVDDSGELQHLAGMSLLNFLDLRARARSFERLAAIEPGGSVLFENAETGTELVATVSATADFFELLGVTPVLGRLFLPSEYESSSGAVFLVTYGAWQRRYGGDPGVVGSSLDREGADASIVGVLPPDFEPPEALVPTAADFWMPLQPDRPRYAARGRRSVAGLGRLAPGVTVDDARAEATAIAEALAIEFPDGNVYPDGSWFGIGVNGLHADTVGTVGRTLSIFLSAAALLLLLAGMNAATLLLARALDRERELGVRTALGARRLRLARLLLVEALLLSLVGGAVGVGLAFVGVELFHAFAPRSIPRLDSIAVDGRVLLAAAAVTIASGVAAGLLPALRLGSSGPWTRLHGSGRGASEPASRLRSLLVGAQLAVAVVLLSGAGLLFNSFVRLVTVEPGFDPDGLVAMNVVVKRPGAPEDEASWQGWDRVLDEMSRVPGVLALGGTSNTPYQSPNWAPRILLPDDPDDAWREGITGYAVTPGYFEALGARLVSGRDFTGSDRADGEGVVIVNEAFVRTQLGAVDPLGIVLSSRRGEQVTPVRIVGVVEDMVQTRAEEGARAAVYRPHTQVEWPWVNVVVRSRIPAAELVPELRRAAMRINAVVPPRRTTTLRDRIAETRTSPRFRTFLIGGFAAVALALAAAGLYGSLAHLVRRRRRELGVRIALGAARSGLVSLVAGRGLRRGAAGLALGLLATLLSTRVLSGFLFGVEANDPLTLAAVALVLTGVGAAACAWPALRAMRVDPVEVLRSE